MKGRRRETEDGLAGAMWTREADGHLRRYKNAQMTAKFQDLFWMPL